MHGPDLHHLSAQGWVRLQGEHGAAGKTAQYSIINRGCDLAYTDNRPEVTFFSFSKGGEELEKEKLLVYFRLELYESNHEIKTKDEVWFKMQHAKLVSVEAEVRFTLSSHSVDNILLFYFFIT